MQRDILNCLNLLKEFLILVPLLLIVSILTLPKKIYWKMKKRKDIVVKWQRERAAYYHLPLAIQNTQVAMTICGSISFGYFCIGKFIVEPWLNDPKIYFNGGESLLLFFLIISPYVGSRLIDDDDDNVVILGRSIDRYITQIKSLFSKKHQYSFENWRFQEEWNDPNQFPKLILYLAPFTKKSQLLKDSGSHLSLLSLQDKKLKSISEILENRKNCSNLPQFPKVLAELIAEYTLNPASLYFARKENREDLSHIIAMPKEIEFEIEIEDEKNEKKPLLGIAIDKDPKQRKPQT